MADLYHMTPRRGPLNITQKRVVEVVRSIIEIEGLEAAINFFGQMSKYFSTESGWPETAKAVRNLFAKVSRKERKEQQATVMEIKNYIYGNVRNLHNDFNDDK